MFTGSGHEPHHFPELQRSFAPGEPPKKSTVVLVAAVGTAVAAVLVMYGQVFAGARFFGDQRPKTAEETIWTTRLTWMAALVFVLTLAAAFVIARRTTMIWPARVGAVLAGVAGGVGLCFVALFAWFG